MANDFLNWALRYCRYGVSPLERSIIDLYLTHNEGVQSILVKLRWVRLPLTTPLKADISCANFTGHIHVLTTEAIRTVAIRTVDKIIILLYIVRVPRRTTCLLTS